MVVLVPRVLVRMKTPRDERGTIRVRAVVRVKILIGEESVIANIQSRSTKNQNARDEMRTNESCQRSDERSIRGMIRCEPALPTSSTMQTRLGVEHCRCVNETDMNCATNTTFHWDCTMCDVPVCYIVGNPRVV